MNIYHHSNFKGKIFLIDKIGKIDLIFITVIVDEAMYYD